MNFKQIFVSLKKRNTEEDVGELTARTDKEDAFESGPTISKKEERDHIIILDLKNEPRKIKSHDLMVEKMDKMLLSIYRKTKDYYFFIFAVLNKRDGVDKTSYVFIRKTNE